MREIKFRAKRVTDGMWAYGGLIVCDDYCIIDNGNEVYVEEEYKFRGDTHFFRLAGAMCDENTIGQFTGLTDKNGKEIYEDDIMQIVTTLDKYLFKVTWNEELGAWCLMMKGDIKEGVKPLGEWLGEYWNKIEVVGNIHDNEELWEY